MSLDPGDELSRLRQRKRRIAMMEAPGLALLGFGVYTKFNTDADSMHPLLGNSTVVNGMLALGAVVTAWGVVRTIPIIRQIVRLENRTRE